MQRIDLSSTPLMGAVERAVAALEQGQLVIYPTETSYGIAADATRLEAIERLRAYKGNRQNKPFSIVMADQTMAESFVTLTDTARRLYTEHLPGPLTVISDSLPETVAPGVANADGSIGVRIPDYPVILEVVKQFGRPVTATSANPSDGKQPYSIDELLAELTDEQKNLVAIILDAGVLPPTLPTTIVDARGETPLVLRQGGIQFSTTELHHTFSAKETQDLGVQISTKLKSFWGRSPIIFALTGEMGSGKTHFTKGIAAGLRIPDLIKSPSYAFVHEYTFTAQREALPFLHVDAWRLENPDELDSLGLARALSQSGIVAIEWAALETEFFQRWKLKAVCVHVDFSSSAENERTLRITTSYPESEAVA